MRITEINNVRSEDIVKLECNGHYDYFVVTHEGHGKDTNWYGLQRITEQEYIERYQAK